MIPRLRQIITTIKFANFEEEKLHNHQFIFSDAIKFEDIQGIESTPWYYDPEGVAYALPLLELYHSLLYIRTCAENRLMK